MGIVLTKVANFGSSKTHSCPSAQLKKGASNLALSTHTPRSDAVLEVAVVVGGVPQIPFTPNDRLSPMCQVTVTFQNA